VKDYAVYWFRKAHSQLGAGGRAGLVATNSISEGRNREAALDHLVSSGGIITSAITNQNWTGDANVHVSIVNWINDPADLPARFALDGVAVSGIGPSLREGTDRLIGERLPQNAGKQFFGVVPGGEGFILSKDEAAEMLYPEALERIRQRVKPHRDRVRRRVYREKWWRLEEPITAMRTALRPLERYIACPAQGKRIYMVWCEPHWCPSNLTAAFAFADDYSRESCRRASTSHGRRRSPRR
jgi:hypothetical protein